jgi:lysozyme
MYYLSSNGLLFIASWEDFSASPYPCSAGKWTKGFGHLILPGEKFDTLTVRQGLVLLGKDIDEKVNDVNFLVKVPLEQYQFDALVSFAFNLGSDIDKDDIAEGLGDSTLLKKLNAGDYTGASEEFGKWVKAKGVVLNGLVRRREAEKNMFLHNTYTFCA